MISSVDFPFRAISTSPAQNLEIAGFAPHPWYRIREAGQSRHEPSEHLRPESRCGPPSARTAAQAPLGLSTHSPGQATYASNYALLCAAVTVFTFLCPTVASPYAPFSESA